MRVPKEMRRASPSQIRSQPSRVVATHAPEAFRRAGKPRSIQSDGIGMILVHVLDDARLGGDEVGCPIGGNE